MFCLPDLGFAGMSNDCRDVEHVVDNGNLIGSHRPTPQQ